MSYSAIHARSYSLVLRKGSAVTFTKTSMAYDETTDSSTPSSVAVSGVAVQDSSGGKKFFEGLTESKALTLYFVPRVLGDEPEEGSTCIWGGTPYTASNVKSVAPDGEVIGSYVVLN